MALLAVIGGLLLCLAWGVREYQLARERSALANAIEHLRASVDLSRTHLRRASEDIYVLQSLMVEKNLFDETELQRGRARLIEAPRRLAEERDAIAKHLRVSPTQLVLDEGEHKVH